MYRLIVVFLASNSASGDGLCGPKNRLCVTGAALCTGAQRGVYARALLYHGKSRTCAAKSVYVVWRDVLPAAKWDFVTGTALRTAAQRGVYTRAFFFRKVLHLSHRFFANTREVSHLSLVRAVVCRKSTSQVRRS